MAPTIVLGTKLICCGQTHGVVDLVHVDHPPEGVHRSASSCCRTRLGTQGRARTHGLFPTPSLQIHICLVHLVRWPTIRLDLAATCTAIDTGIVDGGADWAGSHRTIVPIEVVMVANGSY